MSVYDDQTPKMLRIGPCVVIGCKRPGNSIDHVLFPQKSKPAALKRWLNHYYNKQHVCLEHNMDHKANSIGQRRRHILGVLRREGVQGFSDWMGRCPDDKMMLDGGLYLEASQILEEYIQEH